MALPRYPESKPELSVMNISKYLSDSDNELFVIDTQNGDVFPLKLNNNGGVCYQKGKDLYILGSDFSRFRLTYASEEAFDSFSPKIVESTSSEIEAQRFMIGSNLAKTVNEEEKVQYQSLTIETEFDAPTQKGYKKEEYVKMYMDAIMAGLREARRNLGIRKTAELRLKTGGVVRVSRGVGDLLEEALNNAKLNYKIGIKVNKGIYRIDVWKDIKFVGNKQ